MRAINTQRDPTAARPDARVLPLRRLDPVEAFPDPDAERILDAVRHVLAEIGVRVPAVELKRLGEAGAPVVGSRVRFPGELVDDTLAVQREVVLGARDPACELPIGGERGWLGTGGSAELVVDLETDARRPPSLDDIATIARVADALPQIATVGPLAAALDVPSASRALHELRTHVANTSKHVQLEVPPDAETAAAVVEIAATLAGGEAALGSRPPISAVVTLRQALTLDRLEAASVLARAGIPCAFVATPVAGSTAPATLAGSLVVALAHALAGAAALRLLEPEAPALLGTTALRTPVDDLSSPSGPQAPAFQIAWLQLARRLGMPTWLGGLATGSWSSDWQAGMETGLSATAAWMTGPELLMGAGLRGGGAIRSAIAMVLDAELFDLVRHVPLGFAMDDEALALEVIERVGPGGHFLGETHTLRHMREAWMSRCMDRDTWEAWEEKDRRQPPEHARERVLELLASHEPIPLDPTADERIGEVIAEHERDHG